MSPDLEAGAASGQAGRTCCSLSGSRLLMSALQHVQRLTKEGWRMIFRSATCFGKQRVQAQGASLASGPLCFFVTGSSSSHSALATARRASELSSEAWIESARLIQLSALDSSRRRPLVVSIIEALARSAAASPRHPATVSWGTMVVRLGTSEPSLVERFIDATPVMQAGAHSVSLSQDACGKTR